MRTTLLALLLLPAAAAAQEASPYLPLSHWAMPYIEHLIAAGRIVDPSPLSRPFKVEQITRALDGRMVRCQTDKERARAADARAVVAARPRRLDARQLARAPRPAARSRTRSRHLRRQRGTHAVLRPRGPRVAPVLRP